MSSTLALILTSGGSMTVVLTAFGAAARSFVRRLIRDEASALIATAINVASADIKSEMGKRFDLSDQHKQQIADTTAKLADKQEALALELAKQFGGNGGGMRQAINQLQVDVARMQGQVQVANQVQVASQVPVKGAHEA